MSRSLQVFLERRTASRVPDERGEPIVDDTFLIVFHAHPEDRAVHAARGELGHGVARA